MPKCPRGKKPEPVDKKKYNKIKSKVKQRVTRWPSAYASGQLVREYTRKGGKYRCVSFGDLGRWFQEKWIDICKSSSKKRVPCGRPTGSKRSYPYCRPSKRVSSQTPRTAGELSPAERKRRCSRKRKIGGKTLR